MAKPFKKTAVFAGSFDPIHSGHIRFALAAIEALNLDVVYLLPERQPRNKQATHYAHRLALLKLAVKPHPRLQIMELPDRQFSVKRTLPAIKKLLGNTELYFLLGSDKVEGIKSWPNYQILLNEPKIIIGKRRGESKAHIINETKDWPIPPVILSSQLLDDVSSGKIRQDLMKSKMSKGLLNSSKKYIKDNWLYITLDSTS